MSMSLEDIAELVRYKHLHDERMTDPVYATEYLKWMTEMNLTQELLDEKKMLFIPVEGWQENKDE